MKIIKIVYLKFLYQQINITAMEKLYTTGREIHDNIQSIHRISMSLKVVILLINRRILKIWVVYLNIGILFTRKYNVNSKHGIYVKYVFLLYTFKRLKTLTTS